MSLAMIITLLIRVWLIQTLLITAFIRANPVCSTVTFNSSKWTENKWLSSIHCIKFHFGIHYDFMRII